MIPIVQALEIKIERLTDESCELSAPLSANHNHKGTAFGGSLYNACVVAAYALVYSKNAKAELDLVIRDANIHYIGPVDKDFRVVAKIDMQEWSRMISGLSSKGRARIAVTAQVFNQGDSKVLCEFTGDFVFLKPPQI